MQMSFTSPNNFPFQHFSNKTDAVPQRVSGVQQSQPVPSLEDPVKSQLQDSADVTHDENDDKPRPCKLDGCTSLASKRSPYCAVHTGTRRCQWDGCTKCAQGSTKYCIAHGGGRRCTFPGCSKGARDKFFCAAHGGGKRCKIGDCTKSAVGGSKLCTAHGGGKRCQAFGCSKSAQSSTPFCVRHGGGRKCRVGGCSRVSALWVRVWVFVRIDDD